jgi:hypothetical protein
LFNRFIHWLASSPLHGTVSGAIVVVEYTGRRSGKSFAVPVNYVITGEPDKRRVWITSARERVWWRNFVGGYQAVLLLQGERLAVQLFAVVDPSEVEDGLARYLGSNLRAARYFNVVLDETGQLRQDDLRRAAVDRVMLYADL